MIKYLIGIDGGGSKTSMTCAGISGERIAESRTKGTYYRQDSIEAVAGRLREGLSELAQGIDLSEAVICFGMPGYGEQAEQDKHVAAQLAAAFASTPMIFVNDAVIAWAGAFTLGSGVSIVAGTGSIAYGRDPEGKEARCGGWSEFFSDEGSGYWLGRRTLEMFTKQCDGREERGALYDAVRRHFGIEQNYDVIGIAERDILSSREKTAALQILLMEAAEAGDRSARKMYEEAAHELAGILCGVSSKLSFTDRRIPVSYSGGLFEMEDLILEPMKREVMARINAEFIKPKLSPCGGAILLAAQEFVPEALEDIRAGLCSGRADD